MVKRMSDFVTQLYSEKKILSKNKSFFFLFFFFFFWKSYSSYQINKTGNNIYEQIFASCKTEFSQLVPNCNGYVIMKSRLKRKMSYET